MAAFERAESNRAEWVAHSLTGAVEPEIARQANVPQYDMSREFAK